MITIYSFLESDVLLKYVPHNFGVRRDRSSISPYFGDLDELIFHRCSCVSLTVQTFFKATTKCFTKYKPQLLYINGDHVGSLMKTGGCRLVEDFDCRLHQLSMVAISNVIRLKPGRQLKLYF